VYLPYQVLRQKSRNLTTTSNSIMHL